MKFDLSKVGFSKKDIKYNVTLPSSMTKELAYFLGIHLGDGTMNLYRKYDYYISYSGHIIDEYLFYTKDFRNLFKRLFNKDLRIIEDLRNNKSSIKLTTQSKAIFMFINQVLNIKIGPKINTSIPDVVRSSKYIKSFIRGLADADFSLTFKKGRKGVRCYPVISFNSNNQTLVNEINNELKNMRIKTYSLFNFPHKRYEKVYISNLLQISGEDNLKLWMKFIGFSSPKHLTKYKIWKRYSFCPKNTSLLEREKILNGSLDINIYK